MTALKIRPLPIVETHESFVPSDDVDFIDEAVVRQMILDGNPDNLPRTGNPSLPQVHSSREAFHRHPLAFAG